MCGRYELLGDKELRRGRCCLMREVVDGMGVMNIVKAVRDMII